VGSSFRPQPSSDAGFTLVELLVSIAVLSIASVALYQLLFSVAEGTQTTRSVARVSDEARLGFNRMVRDTREGTQITASSTKAAAADAPLPNPQSFTVAVDFDGSGNITLYPQTNSAGDYEVLTYAFDSDAGTVRLNGELLMRDVECVTSSGACRPVFDYSSSDLQYDWNRDGVTTWQELDQAAQAQYGVVGVGNNNGILDSAELPFVNGVTFHLRVVKGAAATTFHARAQLRNNNP
jgi:prepilin-type N-terminal cleavage/methylation domain-containing protein